MENFKIDFLANKPQFTTDIAEFWCKEWSDRCDEKTIQRKIKNIKLKSGINSAPFILVAFCDDEVVGTGSLFKKDLDSREDLSPWLAGVFVVPKWRNRGVASRLIDAVLAEAKRLGYKKLYLHTETAEELYIKHNWKFLEDTILSSGQKTKIFYKEI